MKKLTQITIIAVLVSMGAAAARAQTNPVVNLNIALTGVESTGTNSSQPFTITTKKIIQDLSGAINPVTGATNDTFSASAKLVLIMPQDGSPIFEVRQPAGHSLTSRTDVTAFFPGTSTLGDGARNATKKVSFLRLNYQGRMFSFHTEGYLSEIKGAIKGKGVPSQNGTKSFTDSAVGYGPLNSDNPTIYLKGTISGSGAVLEHPLLLGSAI